MTERHFARRDELPADGLETRKGGLLVLRRMVGHTYVRLAADPADAPSLRRMLASLGFVPPKRQPQGEPSG